MRLKVGTVAAIALTLYCPVSAWAQDDVPSSSLRGRLFELGTRINTITGIPLSSEAADETNVLAELMSLEVATAPFGTSTGSFTYSFDPALGTLTRSTESFGPSFGKRSLTSGRRKLSVGLNWLHAHYDSLSGFDLENGDLRLAINQRGASPFPFPFGYASAKVNVSSDTAVAVITYGVTDNIDLSVAVPWVRVSIGLDFSLFTASGVDVTPGGHAFVLPRASATGLGDIAIVGKYRVRQFGQGGVAAELEVRLPSGNTDDLRGTGVVRTLASVIYSRAGKVSPHANVGVEVWSDSVPLTHRGDVVMKNQLVYAFGLEVEAHPRATVLIDVIGRRQMNGGQVEYRTLDIGGGTLDILLPVSRGVDLLAAAPGIKWNVAGNVLLTANALLAMTNGGLRANVIPVVGFDWAF